MNAPTPVSASSIAALQEFDALLQRIAAFHAACLPPLQGHTPAGLADRLTQRFAHLFQAAFVVGWCDPRAQERTRMRLGRLSIDNTSGNLQISTRLAMQLLFDFLLRWVYTLLTLLLSIRLRTGRTPATLLYGVGVDDAFRGGSDAEFAAFCDAGPVEPLRDGRVLIVQSANPRSSSNARISYARSPLHALCRTSGFGLAAALTLAWRHAAACASLLRLCASLPAAILLARDFADTAAASLLNEAGLVESVLLTNSNYSSQPLWMRARPGRVFRTHMIWYSQNVRPLLRHADAELAANPANRLIRADVMWVWTQKFADYLTVIGIRAEMHCIGPIIWRLPASASPARPARPTLAVFEVTPVTPEEAKLLGLVDNYYSLETSQAFLLDILGAAERVSRISGREIGIVLKPKRDVIERRDARYFRFVEKLAAKHPNFTILPAQTSLYEMIGGSDLAISIPYSSPVYVASHLGKPSLFYDPTGRLRPTFDAAPGLEFAATPDALQEAIARAIEPR